MERREKRLKCLLLSCLLLALNISTANAEAIPEVMNGSTTVADCVMSYYAMSGAAVANTEWINSLYDGLGSSFGTIYDFAENGMLTINADGTWQATSELTEAIQNSSTFSNLGLNDIFNVSAQEAAAGGGVAAASGAATISGAIGGVASTGVLPVLGGVTAAYWGGIALGTIASHIGSRYIDTIINGAPITTYDFLSSRVPSGSQLYTAQYPTFKRYLYIEGKGFFVTVGNTVIGMAYLNGFNGNKVCKYYDTDTRRVRDFATVHYANGYGDFTLGVINQDFTDWSPITGLVFANNTEFNNYRTKLINGEESFPIIKSPDLIGGNGNQVAGYDSNNNSYTVPDIKPMIDPGTQSGVPLSLQDWLNFANSVQNNNSTTNPLPDNTSLYDAIMDRVVRSTNPDPDPNPNPDPDPNPDPYTPPVVTPTPDPDYDPDPANPEQPDYESEKQNQTETIPDEVPTGAPWTTDGLIDKFPFCIPKDMIDMVKQFSSGTRQAPYISWRFNPPNTPIDYTFNLDLSDFEEVATLLRMLELAAFVVGLAFATRYLIGAS